MRYHKRTEIPGGPVAELIERALPLVVEALQKMLERPESVRPFVVLSDARTEQFVQWCGSKTSPLYFDCPIRGIALEIPPAVIASARRGLMLLWDICGEMTEGLVLLEEDTEAFLSASQILKEGLLTGMAVGLVTGMNVSRRGHSS